MNESEWTYIWILDNLLHSIYIIGNVVVVQIIVVVVIGIAAGVGVGSGVGIWVAEGNPLRALDRWVHRCFQHATGTLRCRLVRGAPLRRLRQVTVRLLAEVTVVVRRAVDRQVLEPQIVHIHLKIQRPIKLL